MRCSVYTVIAAVKRAFRNVSTWPRSCHTGNRTEAPALARRRILRGPRPVHGTGNELPYILYFPTYTAAAAWYHKKLAADLQRGN